MYKKVSTRQAMEGNHVLMVGHYPNKNQAKKQTINNVVVATGTDDIVTKQSLDEEILRLEEQLRASLAIAAEAERRVNERIERQNKKKAPTTKPSFLKTLLDRFI